MILQWKKNQRGRRYGKSEESKKNSKQQKITWTPRTSTIAERPWSAISMMSNIKKRTHEQGYTETDMEEFDRIALEKDEVRGHS